MKRASFQFPKYLLPLSLAGTVVGATVLYKDVRGGARYDGEEQITGRTVIVTGANSGIGKETAKELAKRGGRIIMGCRDMKKCEEARKEVMEYAFNKNVHCKMLDLASLKSIRAFAKDIIENEKRLDILINNAGVMGVPKTLTEDGFELQLGVNYLGPFLLTNLLLDKLKSSALPELPSRIINLSSPTFRNGRIGFTDLNWNRNYNAQHAYSQSKLALVVFSQELVKRLKGTNVNVYAVNPGVTRTNIGRHLNHETSRISSTMIGPLWWMVMKTPIQGAQTVLYCALNQDLNESTGKIYSECRQERLELSQDLNDQLRQRLWLISERWTRLENS